MVTALSLLAILVAGMFLGTMSAAIMKMHEEDNRRARRISSNVAFRNLYGS